MIEPEKYYRHLTPVCAENWQQKLISEQIAVVKDQELPDRFRAIIQGELEEMEKELKRMAIQYNVSGNVIELGSK